MSRENVNVVLVHGAWADGSSWSKIIQLLAAEGLTVVAAPLPLTSFSDDVAALDRALERLTGPVVLVGHAYAGAVIAATRGREGQGACLYSGAGARRGRDGGRYFLSRHAASAGAEAFAGQSRPDLPAGGGLRLGIRPECD
ncbi:esterase/lipase family protein [Rhizobium beringeri]